VHAFVSVSACCLASSECCGAPPPLAYLGVWAHIEGRLDNLFSFFCFVLRVRVMNGGPRTSRTGNGHQRVQRRVVKRDERGVGI